MAKNRPPPNNRLLAALPTGELDRLRLFLKTVPIRVKQVPQRASRWLLMTHDRMHEQDFNLSHEFLAVMLGVQRPTVSVVAASLQQAGLIRYTHGRVTVRNRKGLEAASCECYRIIRSQFDRLRP